MVPATNQNASVVVGVLAEFPTSQKVHVDRVTWVGGKK